jgi:hypothetical protein
MAEHLGDMTRRELREFVEQLIDDRLRWRTRPYKQQGDRPIADVLETIRKNMIIRKPGDPGVVEMLREDRDR